MCNFKNYICLFSYSFTMFGPMWFFKNDSSSASYISSDSTQPLSPSLNLSNALA